MLPPGGLTLRGREGVTLLAVERKNDQREKEDFS